MLVEALGRLAALLAVRPDVLGAEVLLVAVAALLTAAVLAVVAGVAPHPAAAIGARGPVFADLRTALRVSDPDEAGHRRARAPGAGR